MSKLSVLTKDKYCDKVFNRWTVLSFDRIDVGRHKYYMCRCICGTVKSVRIDQILGGASKSCGCLHREVVSALMKKSLHDLTGIKFGRLTVISRTPSINNKTYWKCRCDCGNIKEIGASDLVNGNTKSCGCLQKQIVGTLFTKHKMSGTSQYYCWHNMIMRCSYKPLEAYKYYGGRGITYDPKWETFEGFWEDMGESYLEHVEEFGEKNTSLDRIDVDGNYYKENCRWATDHEQSLNKRNTVMISYGGKKISLYDIGIQYGINYGTLYCRIFKYGWGVPKAIETPIMHRKKVAR